MGKITVYVPEGTGTLKQTRTVHGRTMYRVEGNGFEGWYHQSEVDGLDAIEITDAPLPEDDHLPYDVNPIATDDVDGTQTLRFDPHTDPRTLLHYDDDRATVLPHQLEGEAALAGRTPEEQEAWDEAFEEGRSLGLDYGEASDYASSKVKISTLSENDEIDPDEVEKYDEDPDTSEVDHLFASRHPFDRETNGRTKVAGQWTLDSDPWGEEQALLAKEKELAEQRGVTVQQLYYDITGSPIWLDSFDPEAKRAQKKWDRWLRSQASASDDTDGEGEDETDEGDEVNDEDEKPVLRWASLAVDPKLPAPWRDYLSMLNNEPLVREAAWRDVRSKARRLRYSNKVYIDKFDKTLITGRVQGDTGLYDTVVHRLAATNGRATVTGWDCTCEWGKWAWKRERTFVGRMCSHALAMYYEMQSRDYRRSSKTAAWDVNPADGSMTLTSPQWDGFAFVEPDGTGRWYAAIHTSDNTAPAMQEFDFASSEDARTWVLDNIDKVRVSRDSSKTAESELPWPPEVDKNDPLWPEYVKSLQDESLNPGWWEQYGEVENWDEPSLERLDDFAHWKRNNKYSSKTSAFGGLADEFFDWVKENHPDVDFGSESQQEQESLIDAFAEEQGYGVDDLYEGIWGPSLRPLNGFSSTADADNPFVPEDGEEDVDPDRVEELLQGEEVPHEKESDFDDDGVFEGTEADEDESVEGTDDNSDIVAKFQASMGGAGFLDEQGGGEFSDDNIALAAQAFLKNAGKQYSPMEQQALIDEEGEAEQLGRLNLENSHYLLP